MGSAAASAISSGCWRSHSFASRLRVENGNGSLIFPSFCIRCLTAFSADCCAKMTALAAAYAPDALLSFTVWTAAGRAAIQEGFAKEFAAVDVKITTINVDQAQRLGDWQHSRGTWAGEIKTPDGKTTPMNGHWLIIGTCQGQTCLIGSHVANTDMPPPPQTSAK
jgi:ketosteroid isomerase-like protein